MTALAGAFMIGGALALLAAGFSRGTSRRDLAEEIGYRPPGMPRPLQFGAAARRAERTGFGRRLARDLPRAGIRRPAGEFAVLLAAATIGAFLIVAAIGGVASGTAAAIALAATVRTAIRRRARRAVERFEDALPDALDLLAGSLEAGSSLAQAMEMVAEEGRPPLSEVFAGILSENRLGEPIADAMDSAAQRIGSRDFSWVVRGVRAQQEHGASLAGLLRVAAEFMRARREMHGEVRALTAEGRISAAILIALPFAVAGFFWLANPGYLRTLTSNAAGWGILGSAGVLMAGGTFWLTRIVKVEV
ncbi:MAG TPA: type II secretion system F family protein [Actinomycetota bacterium]